MGRQSADGLKSGERSLSQTAKQCLYRLRPLCIQWEQSHPSHFLGTPCSAHSTALSSQHWCLLLLVMVCLPCLPLPTDPEGARTSSSLSSSFDCVTSGSGATLLTSCSCSTLLRNARMRWCSAAYSCPVSLELAWGFQYSATRKEVQGMTTD